MKKDLYACLTGFALILGIFSFSFAQTRNGDVQTNRLAARLPASDAVVTMDLQRLMNTALPQILSADPKMLGDISGKIDKVKSQTGIDLRQFEQLAVGLSYGKNAQGQLNFNPVVLARGNYKSEALLGVIKLAANGKYREEKSGAKTIYVLKLRDAVPDNQTSNSKKGGILLPGLGIIISFDLDKILSNEIAVTSFDDNTLVFGTLARVREAIGGNPRVAPNILSLATRKPNAVMSFGANVPAGLSQALNLEDNDEIRKNIASIRQTYGSLDVSDGNAALSVAAVTLQPDEAQSLEETLSGLQMLGKGFLSGMKGADKQVYARMAENARISRNNNEVTIDVRVPQSDINVLLGKK